MASGIHSNTIKTEKSEPVKRKLDCISCNFVDKLQKNDESFLLTLFACLISSLSWCQTDGMLFNYMGMGASTALVRDYQSIGINPANLGYDTDYKLSFEIGSMGLSVYSEALTKEEVRYFQPTGGEQLTQEQQAAIAETLLQDGFQTDVFVRPVAFGFDLGNAGGLAIGLSVTANQSFTLGSEAVTSFFRDLTTKGI